MQPSSYYNVPAYNGYVGNNEGGKDDASITERIYKTQLSL